MRRGSAELLVPDFLLARNLITSTGPKEAWGEVHRLYRKWCLLPPEEKAREIEPLLLIPFFCFYADNGSLAERATAGLERIAARRGYDSIAIALAFSRGMLHLREGNADKALSCLEHARTMCEMAAPRSSALPFLLIREAKAHIVLGEYTAAKNRLERAIGIAEKMDDPDTLARARHDLGTMFLRRGNLKSAENSYQRALSSFLEQGSTISAAVTQLALATTFTRMGRTAAPFISQYREGFQRRTPLSIRVLACEYDGDALALSGSDGAALVSYRRGLRLARSEGLGGLVMELHRRLAEFWVERGNSDYAKRHLKWGLRNLNPGSFTHDRHGLERLSSEIKWLEGNPKEALEELISLAERLYEIGAGYEYLLAARRVAIIADELHQWRKADEWWRKTEIQANRSGAAALFRGWAGCRGIRSSRLRPRKTRVDLQHYGIITRCPLLFSHAEAILKSGNQVPVLITGETGTGKELFANLVRKLSARADKPLVVFNAPAKSSELFEAELFGVRKGAYTGAIADRKGAVRSAEGGTLFLDEIGDLSQSLQVKLLRLVENGEVQAVGSDRMEHANVRIVAATNCDLSKLMDTGRFRRDLYYRLRGLEIHLPALRERPEDILCLARHFAQMEFASLRSKPGISIRAGTWLLMQSWPGNVRELKGVVTRAALECRSRQIRLKHLSNGNAQRHVPGDLQGQLNSIQKVIIESALKQCGGNISCTASLLRVHRPSLHRRMKRLGIEHKKA